MATVCRYIVVKVDASWLTCDSAAENCPQATTTVNPSRAPKTSATQVKNGDSAELFSWPTESDRVRSASRIMPTASAIATATNTTRNTQKPSSPNPLIAHLPGTPVRPDRRGRVVLQLSWPRPVPG